MSGIQIMGLPEQPVENVRLENIRLEFKGGGTSADAARNPQEFGGAAIPNRTASASCRLTAFLRGMSEIWNWRTSA